MILQIVLAILPVVVLCFIIYKMDKIEKEPFKLLIRLFVGGIISGLIIYFGKMFLFRYMPLPNVDDLSYLNLFLYTLLVVALIEESFKLLFTYMIGYRSKEFNYKYDIIVYAVFVSLGFACVENIIYAINNSDLIETILRGVLSIPGHAFFGIFMGYYLSKVKMGNKKYSVLAFIIPVLMHTTYNYLIQLTMKTGSSNLLVIYCIYIIFLYIISFNLAKQLSDMDTKIKKSNY